MPAWASQLSPHLLQRDSSLRWPCARLRIDCRNPRLAWPSHVITVQRLYADFVNSFGLRWSISVRSTGGDSNQSAFAASLFRQILAIYIVRNVIPFFKIHDVRIAGAKRFSADVNMSKNRKHWAFLRVSKFFRQKRTKRRLNGGRGGIRTPDTLSGTPVFKTGAINHSATLPL